MKRACIFSFFDLDGIVDDYVYYNLEQLKTVCDYLLIVVNGKLDPRGRERFSDIADDMFVRQNKGLCTWAWKTGIDYIGWEDLTSFDELVLTNDTMFGPLRPLKDVFAEMESESCDFWGNNRVYEDVTVNSIMGNPIPMGHKPEFVSSNLRVIRSRLLRSYEFRHFWDDMPEFDDYFGASVLDEWAFSYDMVNAGFTFQTLCHGEQRGMSPSPTTMEAFDQISRLKVPYLRKKALCGPLNEMTNFKKNDESTKILEYIRTKTNYDVRLIYQSLLRKNNLYDLYQRLSLVSVLPKHYSAGESNSKIGIIFHAYYTDIFPKYVEYLQNFPENTDILFTVSRDKIDAFSQMAEPLKEHYNVDFTAIENRGRDVAAMLIGGRDMVLSGKYDYICFMHDKKGLGAGDKKFSCIGDACSVTSFDNTAVTKEYVQNIVKLFDNNPCLGLACPPPPTHAGYFINVDGDWGHRNNKKNHQELMKKFDIRVPINYEKPPVAPFGSVFWFRPEALRKLFEHEWKYEDFPQEPLSADGEISHALERSHAYFAQAAGYYSSVVMNDEYAGQEFIFYSNSLNKLNHICVSSCGKRWSQSAQIAAVEMKLNSIPDNASTSKKGSGKKTDPQNSIYVKLSNSKFKRFAKKIIPHFIWEQLRKKKCEQTGDVYIKM